MRGVPSLLGDLGIPAAPLLRRSGFRDDPQAWDGHVVSQNQALHLLELSSEAAGDDHFAARISGRLFANLGSVSLTLAHAQTLAEAVRGANRALKLWREGVDFRVYVKGGYGVIAQHLHDVTNTQADILGEMALATICGVVRARIDPSWTPIAVVLPMSRSPFHHGLEDIFAAPVFYRPGPPRVVVHASLLSRPFRRAMDTSGVAPLPPIALMRNDDLLVEQTQMVVDGMMALGDLSLEGAARAPWACRCAPCRRNWAPWEAASASWSRSGAGRLPPSTSTTAACASPRSPCCWATTTPRTSPAPSAAGTTASRPATSGAARCKVAERLDVAGRAGLREMTGRGRGACRSVYCRNATDSCESGVRG